MMNDPKLMRQFGIAANPISSDSTMLNHRKAERSELDEMRLLRFKLKGLGKQLGAAGDTIHRLRADIALLRSKDNGLIGAMYLEQRRQNDLIRADIKDARRAVFQARQELRELKSKSDA